VPSTPAIEQLGRSFVSGFDLELWKRSIRENADNFDFFLEMANSSHAQGFTDLTNQMLATLCEFKLDHPQPLRCVLMPSPQTQ